MKSSLFYLFAGFFWAKSVFGTTLPSGLWQIECKDGLIKEQAVKGNFVTSTEKFYADRNCQQISFIFETSGYVAFTAEHVEWIDFTYLNVSLSVSNSQAIQDLNSRKVCGFTDWTISDSKDITGLRCALFNVKKETQIPHAGDLKYGIFKIEVDRLYYGQMTKENDGSTSERRPVGFNIDYFKHLEIR